MLVLAVALVVAAAILVVVAHRAVRSGRAGARLAAAVVVTAALNIVVLATSGERATQILCSVTSGLLIATLYRWSVALRRATQRHRSSGDTSGRPPMGGR